MKKYKYLFLSFLTIGLVACKKDYLALHPVDSQNTGNFFKTADQFKQAVNGAYAPLQSLYNGPFWVMGEMRSDNTTYEYDPYDRSGTLKEQIDEFTELNNNDYPGGFFSSSYLGIGRCNVILGRLPAAKLDPAVADPMEGQALFLRAFNYFNLVRMFGDVPLVLTEVQSVAGAYSAGKRSSVASVYTAIIADATAAIAKLPVKYTADSDKGRVTKGTAQTLLAEVYMTQHKYDLAITQLNAVVASNAYSLNANFADNFNIATKNGPESIFEIQYIEGPNGLGTDLIDQFVPWDLYDDSGTGYEIDNGAFNGWNIPSHDIVLAFGEQGDKRKDASLVDFTSDEYGIDLPYVKKYQSVGAVKGVTANDFPVYRYADVLLMLAECLNEQAFVADGDAFKYLNMVRRRAGLKNKSTTSTVARLKTPDQQSFRDAVAHERQVELAFENHRWFDLLRTGKAVEVMTAHAASQRDYISGSWDISPTAYSNIRLLYQYPLTEQTLAN